jgi:hypothetical protein
MFRKLLEWSDESFEADMKIRGLLIILLLGFVVVYLLYFVKAGKKSYIEGAIDANSRIRAELTQTNMATLEKAVEYFIANEGRTPLDLKELSLRRLLVGDTSDAWGRPLKYERISDSNFRLVSAGKDGKFGTNDDIVKEY